MNMDYDIIVIGGGIGGYVAAIKASQMGKSTCVIEENVIGGTCLNVGCIPTKALLKSVEVMNTIREGSFYGVTNLNLQGVALDLIEVQNRKNTIVDSLVYGVEGLLRKNNVTVLKEHAEFINPNTLQVGDQKISGANIIIASGSTPKSLSIEVDTRMPVYTSTEILSLTDLPNRIAIIGGGVIGIELAYYLSNIGVKVTIIEFLDRILPMVDEEITEMVSKQFTDIGIEIYTGAKVTSVDKDKVLFQKDGIVYEVQSDAVLMAVGRKPNIHSLNLDSAGVYTERGCIVSDEHLATNVKGIYAIGDVNGKSMLAHTASAEAIVAVENICGIPAKMDYDKIPSAIYIQPEIASIGLTEEQARIKYGDIKVGRFPLIANGKAKIEGDDRGIIKIVSESRYGEIVGVHLFCVHATEMIAELSVAIGLECTADELAKAVHPHPTVSESILEACHAAISKAIHF
jgi:dihydrolipoamide dehydrogenase